MTPRRARTDLVRQYVITGGRSQPSRNTHQFDLVTLVTATGDRPLVGLGPEQTAMVELCRGGYLSVAEIASRLGLPLTVTKVLLGDLVDSDHLVVRRTPPRAVPTDVDILERLLHGLQAL